MASKTKRNAQGNGTIRQRPDGRWEARYTLGRNPGTGKQIQKSIYGKTQAEVRKKLQAIEVDIENGVYAEPTKMTVANWLEIWLQDFNGNVKPGTLGEYQSQCKNNIIPYLGAVKLTKLSTPMIQRHYNTLQKGDGKRQPLSAKTIKNIHGVLHKALAQAVKLNYLRFNPSDHCTLPKVIRKEIQPLDDLNIRDFVTACDGEVFRTELLTALFTGMRQSELLGLTWDNINFENGTITICKQLKIKKVLNESEKNCGGIYYFTTPKNNKTRIITPAPFVIGLLRDRKKEQTTQRLRMGSSWGNGDPINSNLVFTDEIGQHLKHHTVFKHYKKIVQGIGVPSARFHDLRHTYAVTSLQNGDDVKTVQENLGHHTAAFTLDVYGHVTDRMRKESADRMERYINSL